VSRPGEKFLIELDVNVFELLELRHTTRPVSGSVYSFRPRPGSWLADSVQLHQVGGARAAYGYTRHEYHLVPCMP
jgi:hypothetical protein